MINTNEKNYFLSIGDRLKTLYNQKLLPFEKSYQFHELVSAKLEDNEFNSLPMIMFIGQYSTGKTTFIQYLLGEEYPGIQLGPEPTTDKFIAIMYGPKNRIISGNTAAIDPSKPFKTFFNYGEAFLNRFICVEMNNEILKYVTVIDTPGVLSGEQQTTLRGYSFIDVAKHLAERCERIYVIFDSYRLDISDEFKAIIRSFKNFHLKTRFVLNKADILPSKSFMRVYGALMWSLGKTTETPEAVRVYIGSFWNRCYENTEFKDLFIAEEHSLIQDLLKIQSDAVARRLNDLIIRSRISIASAHVVYKIAQKKPLIRYKSTTDNIIKKLERIFEVVSMETKIPIGDFPPLEDFKTKIKYLKFKKMPKICTAEISIKELIDIDLPGVMNLISKEKFEYNQQTAFNINLFSTFHFANQKFEIIQSRSLEEKKEINEIDSLVKIEVIKNQITSQQRSRKICIEESLQLRDSITPIEEGNNNLYYLESSNVEEIIPEIQKDNTLTKSKVISTENEILLTNICEEGGKGQDGIRDNENLKLGNEIFQSTDREFNNIPAIHLNQSELNKDINNPEYIRECNNFVLEDVSETSQLSDDSSYYKDVNQGNFRSLDEYDRTNENVWNDTQLSWTF